MKMYSYQCSESHCGDKTIKRSSYIYNGSSYTGKATPLYWIRVLDVLGSYGIIVLINSLAPGRSLCDFKNVIFNLALLIGIFRSSYDNVLRWMPQDITDDKSTLVQVLAWCRHATSHYLSQCWPRSPMPYGVTRPQWVKLSVLSQYLKSSYIFF